ncbi:MAG TPA: sugar ABC transporter substrate-binding protein [Anaerolineae bacterium]|nr:sugar ABC transporter substrate-binding protein [Anaerolineae bacterium]
MRKLLLSLSVLVASAAALAACQASSTPTPTVDRPVTLRFTYWGSPIERVAVEQMVRAFHAENPDIQVEALYIPDSEYIARVSAMIAAGTPPDVGYLLDTHAPQWASEGKVMDLTDIVRADSELSSRLPETFFPIGPGRTIGTSTATEIMLLFYNKDVFDAAGVSYPPARAEDAWTWDEFLAAARRLTVDRDGRHPGESGFDPDHIQVYGVSFVKSAWYSYPPFIYSNGGEIVNEDGTRLMIDSPEAVEAIQRLADLMWVEHVTPTPAQQERLPPSDALFQTGQLAMDIRGQWKLLDYASMEGLRYGVAVLPKMKEAKTLIFGSPTVIFSGTQHLEAAIKFYKFHNDPRVVDLFAQGLWMPLQLSYYTDPQAIASWIDNPAHPPESRQAIVDYALCCVVRAPHYYVKNFGQISSEVIQPAINRVWNGEASAAQAMAEAVRAATPLMAGRWDR